MLEGQARYMVSMQNGNRDHNSVLYRVSKIIIIIIIHNCAIDDCAKAQESEAREDGHHGRGEDAEGVPWRRKYDSKATGGG